MDKTKFEVVVKSQFADMIEESIMKMPILNIERIEVGSSE